MSPKVSVILATYNHMKYLPLMLSSIITQTFKDFEFIIINDGSTDGTKKYLSRVFPPDDEYEEGDFTHTVIHHPENLGATNSYNEGLKLAKGKYVTWVSSDNIYSSDFLERLVEVIESDKADFVYGGFDWIDENGKSFRRVQNQYMSPHLLMLNNPGMSSFLYRREIHNEIGYYDDEVGTTADTDFWIRISEGDYKIVSIPDILCQQRFDNQCESFKKISHSDESVKRAVDKAVERRKLRRGRKPSLLFVAHEFLPIWYGGVEIYTYNMAKELMRRGYDVSVLYPLNGEPEERVSEYDGIKIYNIVYKINLLDYEKAIRNEEMTYQFCNFLDKHHFDIIHFQHIQNFPLSLIDIAKKCGYPVIVTLHDFWPVCHRTFMMTEDNRMCKEPYTVDHCSDDIINNRKVTLNNVINNDKEVSPEMVAQVHYLVSLRRTYIKEVLGIVDLVTCPSEYVASVYEKFGLTRKILVSEPGIKSIEMYPSAYPPRDSISFGYIGSINPFKNYLSLVNVFKGLIMRKATLRFWGSGTPRDIEILEESIKGDNRITYMGAYTPKDLPDIFFNIDCLIIPSLAETYSFIAREAMSAGIPVMARNKGALTELIHDGINGFLFRDEYDLSSILNLLIMDRKILDYTRKDIKKIKTVEEDANKWIERYRSLL